MCIRGFKIGHNPCVREEAIELLTSGYKRGSVAKQLGVTWPTIDKWYSEFKLACFEIDAYLAKHQRIELPHPIDAHTQLMPTLNPPRRTPHPFDVRPQSNPPRRTPM